MDRNDGRLRLGGGDFILLSLFLLLLFLVLSVNFTMDVKLQLNAEGVSIHFKVGLGRYLVGVPSFALKKMRGLIQSRNLQSLPEILNGLKLGLRFLDNLLQKIDVFHLQVIIGTGDPFLSALGCGGVWALLGPILTALGIDNRLTTAPEIQVQPDYQAANFQVRLHCIFRFRLGQIIVNELRRVTFAWYAKTFS